MLNPWTSVRFKDFNLRFKSGHGRLIWRAMTLNTEEPLIIDWISKFEESDVFLDIGANVGTYSIPAALLSSRVYAVELDPANCYLLKENIIENKVNDRVIIFPFPASDSLEMLEVYYRDRALGDALQSVGKPQALRTIKPAPYVLRQLCFPLDDMFRLFGLERPNKIKIDVDGNEEAVVNGAWGLIQSANELYIELNDDCFGREFKSRLLATGWKLVAEQSFRLGTNCLLSRVNS
jgi:FkbM family methyltransferase